MVPPSRSGGRTSTASRATRSRRSRSSRPTSTPPTRSRTRFNPGRGLSSAEVAQLRPFAGPAVARTTADEHGVALLVVLDAGAVLDAGRERAATEVRAYLVRAEADGYHRRAAVRRRPPVAVGVVAAVGVRQPEGGAVAVDRARLAVVAREYRR